MYRRAVLPFLPVSFLFFSAGHWFGAILAPRKNVVAFGLAYPCATFGSHGPFSWISSNPDRSSQVAPPVACQSL